MSKTENAILSIREAIHFLDLMYAPDDRDIRCPNPDGVAIALNTLIEELESLQAKLKAKN